MFLLRHATQCWIFFVGLKRKKHVGVRWFCPFISLESTQRRTSNIKPSSKPARNITIHILLHLCLPNSRKVAYCAEKNTKHLPKNAARPVGFCEGHARLAQSNTSRLPLASIRQKTSPQPQQDAPPNKVFQDYFQRSIHQWSQCKKK